MAFFDDNNSGIPAGRGRDPLEELDRELAELRISLGEAEPGQAEPASGPEPAPEPVPYAEPVRASAQEDKPSAPSGSHAPAHAAGYRPTPPEAPKSPKTGIVIAALIVALIGIAAGLAVYFINRPISGGADPEPETVAVHDSELGTIEIQPAQGASVNTYDTDNLVKDENGYYSYYVDGKKVSEMGIDLSEYQGEVDFAAVRESGIDFVMLRIGGRYYGDEGGMYSDSAFDAYYEQAKAAGLKVGAYFFSQAAGKEEAVEEAEYTLELLGGRPLDYPIAIDWETIDDDDARTDDVTGEELTALAAAFCDTVKAAGYDAAVYASTSLILQSYDFEIMKGYDFWLADYRELPEKDSMYYSFIMWQYSTDGTVPGIEGSVDMNLRLNAVG